MYLKKVIVTRVGGQELPAAFLNIDPEHVYFVCRSSDMVFMGDTPERFCVGVEGLSTWWIPSEDTLMEWVSRQEEACPLIASCGIRDLRYADEVLSCDEGAFDIMSFLGGGGADEDASGSQCGDDTLRSMLMRDTYTDTYTYEGFKPYHASHGCAFNTPKSESSKKWRVGVELEVECNDDASRRRVTAWRRNWFFCERDGSLGDYGVEFITVPLRYEDASDEEFWCTFCSHLNRYARSWRKSTTGLHVHLGREVLGDTPSECSETIGKLLYFYHHLIGDDSTACAINSRLYGREHTYSEMSGKSDAGHAAHLLGRDVFKSKAVCDRVKDDMTRQSSDGRYFDINLSNEATIEFRKGKGSINAVRIAAVVTWSAMMVEYCRAHTWEELSFDDFYASALRVDCIKSVLGRV